MRSEALLEEIKREFPRFTVAYKKTSTLNHLIHAGLCLITLGGQRQYLSGYYTVIGDTLYVPESWDGLSDVDRTILLSHERVHLRQRHRYTTLGMAFLYLFPFFPLGLAYFRARIEWEAYTETLRATATLKGRAALHDHALRERIITRFTGPAYGWMWPFRRTVEAWYERALLEIEASP